MFYLLQAPPPTDSSRLGAGAAAVAAAAGHELADFPHRELLFGLTTTGNLSFCFETNLSCYDAP